MPEILKKQKDAQKSDPDKERTGGSVLESRIINE